MGARRAADNQAMIKAQNLTKIYSGRTALDGISFEVRRGEMVGLLGPNGAGKSTTMRILAGYLSATRGSVSIDSLDVLDHPLEVRRRIGYLPENVSLYPEMRVGEYLDFRGRLRGMAPRRMRERIEEVKVLCGLHNVARRIIGHLSRGYHQRIGLADALLHEPDLLLLDEPTIGLDPNQIRAIRELVKTLAHKHTVVLSTHFLAEAEMLCGRVLILNRGRIVASDSPAVLTGRLKNRNVIVAEISGPTAEVETALRALPGVAGLKREREWSASSGSEQAGAWGRYLIECGAESDLRIGVFKAVAQRGWQLRELRIERDKLEDVFAEITGDMGLE